MFIILHKHMNINFISSCFHGMLQTEIYHVLEFSECWNNFLLHNADLYISINLMYNVFYYVFCHIFMYFIMCFVMYDVFSMR